MNPTRTLRTLVLADLGLLMAHVVTSFLVEPASTQPPAEPGPPGVGEIIAGTTLLVLWVAALVGLWRVRRWARRVYVVTTMGGLLFTLFTPPVESTAPEEFFYGLEFLVSGVIIAVTYYSPVAHLFRPAEAAV